MDYKRLVDYLLSQHWNFESLARTWHELKDSPELADYVMEYAKNKYPKDYDSWYPSLLQDKIPLDVAIIKKEYLYEALYNLVVKQLDLEQLKEIHTNLKNSDGKVEKALRKYIEFQISVWYSIDLDG